MKIKDLKVGDKVRCFGSTGAYLVEVENVVVDMTHYRDVAYVVNANNVKGTLTDNDEWIFYTDKVSNKKQETNDVQQKKRFEHLGNVLDSEQEDALDSEKEDVVNQPNHYTYSNIQVIDYCDQVCKEYPADLSPYVFNVIKYISRSEFKNGKEDCEKAKFYLERIIEKWDEAHEKGLVK